MSNRIAVNPYFFGYVFSVTSLPIRYLNSRSHFIEFCNTRFKAMAEKYSIPIGTIQVGETPSYAQLVEFTKWLESSRYASSELQLQLKQIYDAYAAGESMSHMLWKDVTAAIQKRELTIWIAYQMAIGYRDSRPEGLEYRQNLAALEVESRSIASNIASLERKIQKNLERSQWIKEKIESYRQEQEELAIASQEFAESIDAYKKRLEEIDAEIG